MRNNRRKINQSIMYGVVGMAIVVMLVVFVFMYLFTPHSNTANEEGNEPAAIEQQE